MQGFFLALHASTPAALGLAVLLHLWAPAWLAPLAQRPVWPMWALIGAWLLMSALASLALRPLALWRGALGGTAALLALAGGGGPARGAALAPAMLASMATLGLACLGLAAFIGPRRVHAGRRKTPHHRPPPALGQTAPHAAQRGAAQGAAALRVGAGALALLVDGRAGRGVVSAGLHRGHRAGALIGHAGPAAGVLHGTAGRHIAGLGTGQQQRAVGRGGAGLWRPGAQS